MNFKCGLEIKSLVFMSGRYLFINHNLYIKFLFYVFLFIMEYHVENKNAEVFVVYTIYFNYKFVRYA